MIGDPVQIQEMYESGLSQREIAEDLGISRGAVSYAMRYCGIPRRPAIKRDQRGDRNPRWKGNNASYNSFHRRVTVARGRASSCAECGCTDEGKTYDWANVSGRYEDVQDYRPMCRSCHQRFDGRRRRERGEHRWRSKAA